MSASRSAEAVGKGVGEVIGTRSSGISAMGASKLWEYKTRNSFRACPSASVLTWNGASISGCRASDTIGQNVQ